MTSTIEPTTPKQEDAVAEIPIKAPIPPFTWESAVQKVRMAEDAWNSQDPDRVKMAYSADTKWRNRSTFLQGRDQVRDFLQDKWQRELDYRLIKEIWAHSDDRIAVRFCYEYHNDAGEWFRAHGNENWYFDAKGYMRERHASINDVPISEEQRQFLWPNPKQGRPVNHPGLSELGL